MALSPKSQRRYTRLLTKFWRRTRADRKNTVQALIKASNTWIKKPDGDALKLNRAEFEEVKADLLALRGQRCFVCGGAAHHRHHIIPLYRGGQNEEKNLIPLCRDCHALAHPWMTTYSSK